MQYPVQQTVTRLGQHNTAGDSRALFLKQFAGEVLNQFKPTNLALKLTRVRLIDSGKSASFPIIGRSKAKYHTAGELVSGNSIPHSEITVTIDDFAISPVFISELDEAMADYEVRSHYTAECSASLSELIDRNIFRMVAKTAQITNESEAKAAGLTPLPDDKYIQPYVMPKGKALDGRELVNALYKVRTRFRKVDVKQPLTAVFPPEQFEALTNASGHVNNMAWMNSDVGATSTINSDSGTLKIAGITVYESNQLPQLDESLGLIDEAEPLADETLGSGRKEAYRGDYSRILGLVFARDCVATAVLRKLTTIVHAPEATRLGHTIMAKVALGHNILRHQLATAILRAEPVS